MVSSAACLAVLLYLIPLFVLFVVRSRREREIGEIALDIPFGVALDMLLVLVLSRVMRLETATFVSRFAWVLGGAGYLFWRKRTGRPMPVWPAALGKREIATVVLVVYLAAELSMIISRPCLNVDRRWHIPLVASLRGQTAPFHNVYDPAGNLAYHFAGDVFAVELQVLSWDTLHSSLALSLAHDVLFGLTAATIALLLRHIGVRQVPFIVLGTLGFLLTGPITIARPDGATAGYSYIDFLRVSYRPHVSLAALLLVGFVGALWERARRTQDAATSSLFPRWIAITAIMALTDEATIGLLGFALGVAWVVDPSVLGPTRRSGVAVLVGLFAALVVSSKVFGGSLHGGSTGHLLAIVPLRFPGYHHPILSFDTVAGREMFSFDMASIAAVWLGGAFYTSRDRTRRSLATFAFFSTLTVSSLLALTRVEVGGVSEESHRFMTAIMLASPLIGMSWLAAARQIKVVRSIGAIVPALIAVSMTLSAASTIHWLRATAPGMCDKPSAVFTSEDLHATNCRAELGSWVGERTRPTYVSKTLAYWYGGCRPIYAPTSKQPGQHWETATGSPIFGYEAIEVLTPMLGPNERLRAICPPSGADDPVCTFAREHQKCRERGPKRMTCELSADDRIELLATKSQ